jgi:DNA-binding NarL/FixJ family response regulator
MPISIAVADDHQLFLKSLSSLINNYPDFAIVVEAFNGEDLICKIGFCAIQPDLVLMDVNMPIMNGNIAARDLLQKYPGLKIVAFSIKDDDESIINMIKAGCCAYLLKDIHPDELEKALKEVYEKGNYSAGVATINYQHLLQQT